MPVYQVKEAEMREKREVHQRNVIQFSCHNWISLYSQQEWKYTASYEKRTFKEL